MIDKRLQQILLWTPRLLGLFGVFFLGLFALDVFEMDAGLWEMIGGFLIHLIPSALVLLAVALGWRRPAVGGALFLALALVDVVVFRDPWNWALIAGPMVLISILFLTGWRMQSQTVLQ